ncbi:MAG: methyltransferase domain-containing protein [Flavobacteriales bacterium]|nr:methyltransferase domain-containing protein [Flavobacteriales bacterium]
MSKYQDYILGTDADELFRLGLQHQVWAKEVQEAYSKAGFRSGQTLLDLGCGPGFCTKEMAFIVGKLGRVVAVDKSAEYLKFVDKIAQQYGLNIETIHSDFNELQLTENSIDGIFCRWAMAWINNIPEVLTKLKPSLKLGATLVFHEYFQWDTHQMVPSLPGLAKGIAAALKSFKSETGEIDAGKLLPKMLMDLNFEIVSIKLMPKIGRPGDLVWQWPVSFYKIYFPKLVAAGLLLEDEMRAVLRDIEILENTPETLLCCPLMTEIIARKID